MPLLPRLGLGSPVQVDLGQQRVDIDLPLLALVEAHRFPDRIAHAGGKFGRATN